MFDRDPYTSTILRPGDPRRSLFRPRAIAAYVNWEFVGLFAILFGFFAFILWNNQETWRVAGTIGLMLVGWVFSLCLHEFAHAATAYLGGDHSESTTSYLSFNPLKYMHPVLSIVLPVVFIALGGIALPGGAVYLRRDLVRNRGWQSAISLAGPLMNLLVAIVLAIPLALGIGHQHPLLGQALAALGFFQIAAVILNLLPIPGLDGFGIIAPWLPRNTRVALMAVANYGIFILFFLIWQIPFFQSAYFGTVALVLGLLHIDLYAAYQGIHALMFLQP